MVISKTCRVFTSLIQKREWMKNLKNWMIWLILLTNKMGIGLCEKIPRLQRRLNLDKDSDTGWPGLWISLPVTSQYFDLWLLQFYILFAETQLGPAGQRVNPVGSCIPYKLQMHCAGHLPSHVLPICNDSLVLAQFEGWVFLELLSRLYNVHMPRYLPRLSLEQFFPAAGSLVLMMQGIDQSLAPHE